MSIDDMDRRKFGVTVGAAAVAAGLASVGLAGVGSAPAQAYQGNMERTTSALYEALAALREATPNKGGHRETAIQLVQQAIAETQAGIQWANEHGGGGAQ